MFARRQKQHRRGEAGSTLILCLLTLAPVADTLAASNFTFTSSFTSADPVGRPTSMDVGGTWNGTTEVTNITGDTFTFGFTNTGPDPAFDFDIEIEVPNGWRVPGNILADPNAIDLIAQNGACGGDITGIDVTFSSNTVNFAIPADQDIPVGCEFEFDIGLRTNLNAAAGLADVILNVDYNEIDDTPPVQTASDTTNIQVNGGSLALNKVAVTTVVANGQTADFRIDVTNEASAGGGLFNVVVTDTPSANFTGLSYGSVAAFDDTTNNPVAVPPFTIGAPPNDDQITFEYIPTNVRVEIDVSLLAVIDPTDTTCPNMTNDASAIERVGSTSSDFETIDFNVSNALSLTHDLANSYCELCGTGTVVLTVENVGGISLTGTGVNGINVTEDLQASGLTYVPGSMQISIDGAPAVAANDPLVSGTNGSVLNWNSNQIPELVQLDSPFATLPANPISLDLIFEVERAAALNEEGLATAIRDIQPSASYALVCGGISQNTVGTEIELPIRQAEPLVTKLGRNVDAGQDATAYADTVFGHIEDSVIWRVDVANAGQAGLQDLLIDDAITGNFDINWICEDELSATAAVTSTNGPAPAGCVSAGGGTRTSVLNFAVDDPFGTPNNDEPTTFIDAPAGGNGFLYYVGRIQSTCTNQANSTNIEWGCEADSPPEGGLTTPASVGGSPPAFSVDSTATLSTQVVNTGLDIDQTITDIDGAGPIGSSGLVTITLTNNTGATIRNIDFTNTLPTLPTEYVVDPTFTPDVVVTPAYGNVYDGMIDTITWTNQDANILNNTAPNFLLTSSTQRAVSTIANDDRDLLREGDIATITFRIVNVNPARFDLNADIDVVPEVQGDTTDPDSDFTVQNRISINFDNICGQTNLTVPDSVVDHAADIEDLDISISDALFILTNDPGTPLALNVDVTNNGGADADNYTVYIALGDAMTAQAPLPAGCVASPNPAPQPLVNEPEPIPASAAIFACNVGAIAPAATERITINVIKDAGAADDDLLFRADVIGEITLSDGTPLTDPTPGSITITTPNQQVANNYTLDVVRSRVLGFNLNTHVWHCTESGVAEPPAPTTAGANVADLDTQIGEDCHFFVESGGWFGFDTTGFVLVRVENVNVFITDASLDGVTDGRGFIPFDDGVEDYDFNNTGNIVLDGANGGATATDLDETDIRWVFNTTTAGGLEIRDEFFRVNYKSRLLNEPIDCDYNSGANCGAPNEHAAVSMTIARTSFEAIFQDPSLAITTINVDDQSAIPGYPIQAVRQVDFNVTEPDLVVVKEVCNESLSVPGPSCTPFVTDLASTDASAGDSDDSYIYRVTLTNQTTSGGIARVPAYNVIATDELDASDLMLIAPGGATPFDSDGLDNDGDGLIDGADGDGEFLSLDDNVTENGDPATFVISHTHSTALEQIDPGASVTYYYRIDPDQDTAPLQTLTNSITTQFDSLPGDFGSQNEPQFDNTTVAPDDDGRARIYDAIDQTSSAQLLPLTTSPIQVIALSNSTLGGSPQEVVVGEEILYELTAAIPVANLRQLQIAVELPPGLSCADIQNVDLDAAPYAAAGFVPGGVATTTCNAGIASWDFGTQALTAGTPGSLFDFDVRFTARIDNVNDVVEACDIRVGGAATGAPAAFCTGADTGARLTYENDAAATVTLTYGSVDLIVREPVLDVTLDYPPHGGAPDTDDPLDAGDIVDLLVTITNNGTATAYNPEILSDLVGTNLTFLDVLTGTNPPDAFDEVTLGDNQPIFRWTLGDADDEILPSETQTFTIRVRVNEAIPDPDIVEPQEVLDVDIEARWTSLPDTDAINDIDTAGARTIGADGDADGMRNGQLSGVAPTSVDPPNDYTDTASDAVAVQGLTITKTDVTSIPLTEIGSQREFQIVIDLPEGQTVDVLVTDELLSSAGGNAVSYFIENNADFDITYTFNDIDTINGDAPSEAAFVAGDAVTTDGFPADNSSGLVTWDIGLVDTASEDDNATSTVNPQIIINYFARINNDTDTDAGDTLQNGAELTYDNGEDGSTETRNDNTPEITVSEPDLDITGLTVVNATQANVDTDAGDFLNYTLTVENIGDATAYDVNIVDTIAPGLIFNTVVTPTATIDTGGGPVAVAGFTATPSGTPAGPLVWGRDNADENIDIPAGATFVLTYSIAVQDDVQPGLVVDNAVVIDWTSLDGSAATTLARERGFSGDCSAIVQPDDYCDGAEAAPLTIADNNTIVKAYVEDTFTPPDTGATAADAELRIGDTVQYTLTIDMQEGATEGVAGTAFTIVDTIPAGMEFVTTDDINGVAGPGPFSAVFPFSHVDIAAPLLGANTITWTVDDLINTGVNDLPAPNNDANNDFVITYTLQVVDDVLAQTGTTSLQNDVVFNYVAGDDTPLPKTDDETVDAVQPVITLADIAKVRRSGIPSGTPITAGDTMDFELQSCNSGDGPAYDIIVEDLLDVELEEGTIRAPGDAPAAGTDPRVTIGGVLAADPAQYTYTAPVGPGGTMRFVFDDIATPLLPGECIVIQYDIDTDATVGPNVSWDNSFQLVEYHSLDADDTVSLVAERETYDTLIGPVVFNMNTFGSVPLPDKSLLSPTAPSEATIGELVTYQVLVPSTPVLGALHDLTLTDTLNASLTYVSASVDTTAVNAYTGTLSDTGSSGTNVSIVLDSLVNPGEQATINIVARVDNNAVTDNTTAAFGNTVSYTFADAPGGSAIIGGTDATDPADDIIVIEPELVLQSKTVENLSKPLVTDAPDAGDILRYTLTFDALGGARNSDAFDVTIIDSLGVGLAYSGNSTVTGTGLISNTIGDPDTAGSGAPGDAQTLTWDLGSAAPTDIDVTAGSTGLQVAYEVVVLDSVLAAQDLTNSAVIRWTSIDGVDANERDGTGGINDYQSGPQTTTVTSIDTSTITKARSSDTSPALTTATDVRIGDLVDYAITLNLQEGVTPGIVTTDLLPEELTYVGLVSVNGNTGPSFTNVAPFTHTAITEAANVATAAVPGGTQVTLTLPDITNAGTGSPDDGNNDFVIVYRAQVADDLQSPAQLANPATIASVQNSVNFDYTISTGPPGTTTSAVTQNDTATIDIQQPNLNLVKTVTTEFGDLTVVGGEDITYRLDVQNTGNAPANDIRIEDTIPDGLRQSGVTITSVELLGTGVLANPVAGISFNATTGLWVWEPDAGVVDVYSIPAGQTLRIEYLVEADALIGAGITGLVNSATVTQYHSFDDDATTVPAGAVVTDREVYGPSNTDAAPALSTPAPSQLQKQNPASNLASIGIPFTYRITVPQTPQAIALYDVRILDDLSALAPNVDLTVTDIQKISVTGSWVPENTGTPDNLVIEDTTNGIDLLPGEQAIIDVTVVLRNTSNNVDGDTFINTASYTFNATDNTGPPGNGGGISDVAITIVEPLTLTMQKTGPAFMTFGTPDTFTMNVQNTGNGPAFDITVTDQLPNPTVGGMCDNAPTNVTAGVFLADGTTPAPGAIALVQGTHYDVVFAGDPVCTLTVTMTTSDLSGPGLGLIPTQRLIITYDQTLDLDNVNGATLDNVAVTSSWFSADTPAGVSVGEIREYLGVIDAVDPGTPGIIDDEDIFTTTVQSPELQITKNAFNVSTGAPAFTAEPTETLRYEITVTNVGPIAASNFTITDEPDRLNGAGFFVPGSMSNITVSQAGADTSATDINAGANAAGILDVGNLNLTAAGGGDDTLTINFEMTLQNVIDSGTLVVNQAEGDLTGFTTIPSDDPNLPGTDDPTLTIIGSTPTFSLLKTSDDVTGDAAVLDAGDILRYTITAQNIGAEDAINTILRDQIPANTVYVPNTTTLNGLSVADPAAGVSPLQDGFLINAADDPTTGAMSADFGSTTNIATVTFDVQLSEDVVNGTVISNQAFVVGDGVGSGAFPAQPSDDPDTDILGDPTRDVVGNVAILDAQKIVELTGDFDNDGNADPGDTLRYTITVTNSGTVPALDVVLSDTVPSNTTYRASSTLMNGESVPDVGGNLPTITGLPISSADITPPLPVAGNGRINAMQTSVVSFEVIIGGVADGTVISNQGEVTSADFPDELTDADGNDINGDQPTEIITGSAQSLTITKDVFVVGGGTAQPGATLEYVIQVENTGTGDIDLSTASGEVLKVFDDIDTPGLISYVAGSARLNGQVNPNVVFDAPRLIVNYDDDRRAISTSFMFEPGDRFTVRYLAQIDANAVQGTNIVNTAAVDWGTQDLAPVSAAPAIFCSGGAQNVDACSTATLGVGGAPGVATLTGSLWHDANFDEVQDVAEIDLEGWEVEIYFGSGSVNPADLLDSVFTDVDGNYTIQGLVPNDGDLIKYALRFRPPGASTSTASLGTVVSPFFSGNGPSTLTFFEVIQGSHIPGIDLPIQPNGVVYDSVVRTPVAGARVQMINPTGIVLPASCFDDAAQQDQVTTANGYYKFELNFSSPGICNPGMDFRINVFPPSGFFDLDDDPATPNVSVIIPPQESLPSGASFDVAACSGDSVPGTSQCELQTSEQAPDPGIAPRAAGTEYYQALTFSNGLDEEQIYNNHIAVDPELDSAISISKISALENVTRGQLVPYTITLNNSLPAPLYDLLVEDLFPAGFKYVAGSGRIQYGSGASTPDEPALDVPNLTLTWPATGTLPAIPALSTAEIDLLLVVGAGVSEGEYINRAQARNALTGGLASGVASATVRVVPDPTFDCSDVIGKVFDDANLNGYQDEGEEGIASAKVITARGLEVTTDQYGRFHITCAVVPNEDRGSNFIIKLDERSLPTGYRVTTENPRVHRATRGKMLKFNFGAAIHRVVRLDMADAVFELNSTEVRPQWRQRINLLMEKLVEAPSVLRLTYLGDVESPDLVEERLQSMKDEIEERWAELDCCYRLEIETEVYWRRGKPASLEAFD